MTADDTTKLTTSELLSDYAECVINASAMGMPVFKERRDALYAELVRRLDAAEGLADHCQRILNAVTLPVGYDNELADLLAAYRGAT